MGSDKGVLSFLNELRCRGNLTALPLGGCSQAAILLLWQKRGDANSGRELLRKAGRYFSEMDLHQSDKEKSKHKHALESLRASKVCGFTKRQKTGFCIGLVLSLWSCPETPLVLFHLSKTMNKEKTAAYCQSHLHTFWCYYTTEIITSFQETSRQFCLGILYSSYFYRKL